MTHSTGPWAHPPRRAPYLARHGVKWIILLLACLLAVAVGTWLRGVGENAIAQAAYDLSHFHEYH